MDVDISSLARPVTSQQLLDLIESRSKPRYDQRNAAGEVVETKVPAIEGEHLATAVGHIAQLAVQEHEAHLNRANFEAYMAEYERKKEAGLLDQPPGTPPLMRVPSKDDGHVPGSGNVL